MKSFLVCLCVLGATVLMAQKGDYTKYEAEDATSVRKKFDYTVPEVPIEPDDAMPVNKWAKVDQYFTGTARIVVDAHPDMIRLVNKHTRSVTFTQKGEIEGYRVQIYAGVERATADKDKQLFLKTFAGTAAYMVYEEPSFRVRVGDFATRNDAEQFCKEVRALPELVGSFVVRSLVKAPKLQLLGDEPEPALNEK